MGRRALVGLVAVAAGTAFVGIAVGSVAEHPAREVRRAAMAGDSLRLWEALDQLPEERSWWLWGQRPLGSAAGVSMVRAVVALEVGEPRFVRALTERAVVGADGSTALAQRAFLIGCVEFTRAQEAAGAVSMLGSKALERALPRAEAARDAFWDAVRLSRGASGPARRNAERAGRFIDELRRALEAGKPQDSASKPPPPPDADPVDFEEIDSPSPVEEDVGRLSPLSLQKLREQLNRKDAERRAVRRAIRNARSAASVERDW